MDMVHSTAAQRRLRMFLGCLFGLVVVMIWNVVELIMDECLVNDTHPIDSFSRQLIDLVAFTVSLYSAYEA